MKSRTKQAGTTENSAAETRSEIVRPARTELVWEGKYDADGRRVAPLRVTLPFQTVETVNESAADRRRTLELFGGRTAASQFLHEAGPTSPRAAGQSSRRRRYPTRGHRRRAAPAQHELRQHDARGGDAVPASVRHGGAAGVPVKWIAGVRRRPGQPHGATAAGTRSF